MMRKHRVSARCFLFFGPLAQLVTSWKLIISRSLVRVQHGPPMNSKCPICRVLDGKRPGRGKICPECGSIEGLSIRYDEFSIYSMVKKTVWLMTLFFPAMLIGHIIILAFTHKLNILGFISQLVGWGVWCLNVFYLYPKMGVPCFGKWQKMEDARDKLFLAKLSGRPLEK